MKKLFHLNIGDFGFINQFSIYDIHKRDTESTILLIYYFVWLKVSAIKQNDIKEVRYVERSDSFDEKLSFYP